MKAFKISLLLFISNFVLGQNLPIVGPTVGSSGAGPIARFSGSGPTGTNNITSTNIYQGVGTFSNIGIGTPNPQAPFHVAFTNPANTGIRIDNNGNFASVLTLNNASNRWELWSTGSNQTGWAGHFSIVDYTNGQAPRLTIKPVTGEVGIGTTAPTHKLHVDGTTKITSDLDVGVSGSQGVTGSGIARLRFRAFVGSQQAVSAAVLNSYDDFGSGAFYSETNHTNPNSFNALFKVNHNTTKALTVINTLLPNYGWGGGEVFKVYGDGKTEISNPGEALVLGTTTSGIFSKNSVFYGDGSIHAPKNVQIGFNNVSAIQNVNTALNIKGIPNSYGIICSGNHTSPFGTNILSLVNNQSTKTFAVSGLGDIMIRPQGQIAFDVKMASPLSNKSVYTFFSNGIAYISAQLYIGNQTQNSTAPHADAIFTVAGKMVAKSCVVTGNNWITSPWADYVFADNYVMPKLSDIEAYYKEHKHLPEIPSDKEIYANGIDLGQMNAILVKKVEELTVIIVEQDKRINSLEAKLKD
jgi:hypothetical protein